MIRDLQAALPHGFSKDGWLYEEQTLQMSFFWHDLTSHHFWRASVGFATLQISRYASLYSNVRIGSGGWNETPSSGASLHKKGNFSAAARSMSTCNCAGNKQKPAKHQRNWVG